MIFNLEKNVMMVTFVMATIVVKIYGKCHLAG